MMNSVLNSYLENLPNYIDAKKTKGVNARVQFNISGDGGGTIGIIVSDGNVTASEGAIEKPDFVVNADLDTALRILNGSQNPMSAVMTGKVKVSGDMAAGMKLISLLK
jgi:putative sterol carrier protein